MHSCRPSVILPAKSTVRSAGAFGAQPSRAAGYGAETDDFEHWRHALRHLFSQTRRRHVEILAARSDFAVIRILDFSHPHFPTMFGAPFFPVLSVEIVCWR